MTALLRRVSRFASELPHATVSAGFSEREMALYGIAELLAHYKVVRPTAAEPLRESAFLEAPTPGARLKLLDLARPRGTLVTPGTAKPAFVTVVGAEGLAFAGDPCCWLEPEDDSGCAIDPGRVSASGLSIGLRVSGVPGSQGSVHHVLGATASAAHTAADRAPCLALGYAPGGQYYLRLLNAARQDICPGLRAAGLSQAVTTAFLLCLSPTGEARLYHDGELRAGPCPTPMPLLTDGQFQIGRTGLHQPNPSSQSFVFHEAILIAADLSQHAGQRAIVTAALSGP